MPPKSVLIKKYENRRLYDATNSRYVNLDEVARMVQQGCDVQVVDASSGEDITRMILTQIIAEGAKTSDSNFPLDILRQMVVASGRASQDSAVRYTKAMLDLYQSAYRAMVPGLNPFDFLHNAQSGSARSGSAPSGSADSEPSIHAMAEDQPPMAGLDEMDELKARIAELEKAVSSINPAKLASKSRKHPGKKSARRSAARKR